MLLESLMMFLNVSSVNEFPSDDRMVYDYLTAIVKHVMCHRNKNNNVNQSVGPSSRRPAQPEKGNFSTLNNGSRKERPVNPVRVGSSNALVTTTKDVNLGPVTINVISITATHDLPSRPLNQPTTAPQQPSLSVSSPRFDANSVLSIQSLERSKFLSSYLSTQSNHGKQNASPLSSASPVETQKLKTPIQETPNSEDPILRLVDVVCLF